MGCIGETKTVIQAINCEIKKSNRAYDLFLSLKKKKLINDKGRITANKAIKKYQDCSIEATYITESGIAMWIIDPKGKLMNIVILNNGSIYC